METTDPVWDEYASAIFSQAKARIRKRSPEEPLNAMHFSVCSIMLSTEIADDDQDRANGSKYFLGNTIPPVNGSYITWSNLFTSYFLLLNHGVLGIAAPFMEEGELARLKKKMTDLVKPEEHSSPPESLFRNEAHNLLETMAINMKSVLQTVETIYAGARKLMSHRPRLNPRDSRAMEDLLKAINRCRAASNTQSATQFNMPVRMSSQTALAYTPLYILPKVKAQMQKWQGYALEGKKMVSIRLGYDNVPMNRLSGIAPEKCFFRPIGRLSQSLPPDAGWTLNLSLTGFGCFPIEQGKWFGREYVGISKRHLLPDAPDFFSDSGSMPLIPAYAVIGYQPKIQVCSATRESHQALKRNGAPLDRVGPFRLDLASPALPDSDLCLSFNAANSKVPGLLGVISHRTDA